MRPNTSNYTSSSSGGDGGGDDKLFPTARGLVKNWKNILKNQNKNNNKINSGTYICKGFQKKNARIWIDYAFESSKSSEVAMNFDAV